MIDQRPPYMGPGVVWESTIGITPPCVGFGCRAALFIGFCPDTDELVAQHGDNPEHQRRWPFEELNGPITIDLVDAWVKEIHQTPAEAFIIDPETGAPTKIGDVLSMEIS